MQEDVKAVRVQRAQFSERRLDEVQFAVKADVGAGVEFDLQVEVRRLETDFGVVPRPQAAEGEIVDGRVENASPVKLRVGRYVGSSTRKADAERGFGPD